MVLECSSVLFFHFSDLLLSFFFVVVLIEGQFTFLLWVLQHCSCYDCREQNRTDILEQLLAKAVCLPQRTQELQNTDCRMSRESGHHHNRLDNFLIIRLDGGPADPWINVKKSPLICCLFSLQTPIIRGSNLGEFAILHIVLGKWAEIWDKRKMCFSCFCILNPYSD